MSNKLLRPQMILNRPITQETINRYLYDGTSVKYPPAFKQDIKDQIIETDL
jgi:hypothetical protein